VFFVAKILISAVVISAASWLAGRSPALAGFLVAMPVATVLVLPFAQLEHGRTADTIALARSILLAIPASLAFFVPFLFAERLGLGFWPTYALAWAALAAGYALHRIAAGMLSIG